MPPPNTALSCSQSSFLRFGFFLRPALRLVQPAGAAADAVPVRAGNGRRAMVSASSSVALRRRRFGEEPTEALLDFVCRSRRPAKAGGRSRKGFGHDRSGAPPRLLPRAAFMGVLDQEVGRALSAAVIRLSIDGVRRRLAHWPAPRTRVAHLFRGGGVTSWKAVSGSRRI